MNPDTGEIKFGPMEILAKEGFTEEVTVDEADELVKFPAEKRMEVLRGLRESRIKELERSNARQENMLNEMKKTGKKVQYVNAKKRDGSHTKKSMKQKKNVKNMIKKSKKKNRKGR